MAVEDTLALAEYLVTEEGIGRLYNKYSFSNEHTGDGYAWIRDTGMHKQIAFGCLQFLRERGWHPSR